MPLHVIYGTKSGNTVPYPPLYDKLRCNHGFIDLRGNPTAAASITETQSSPGLLALLTQMAQPASAFISLGCDLGGYDSKGGGRLHTRCVAGGYVQFADARLHDSESDFLKRAAAHFEAALHSSIGPDRWKVRFEAAPVAFEFGERVQAHSVWIWFDAKASTRDRAVASRERLLSTLAMAAKEFESLS